MTAILLTLSCICLCCSICLRYRGCSSRAPLHQLQWRGLPSPAPVQLCLHVEMQLQTTTYSHRQSTNPNKLQAQRQNTNLYHLMPTTNYQVPAQKALTLSTVHVLEDMHQLQGKKGLPPPSSLLRKAGQGAGGIYGPRARRTRHAYSLQKTQIYGTLAWMCWREEGESRNRY